MISLFKGKCVVVGCIRQWLDAEDNERKAKTTGKGIDNDNILFNIWDEDVMETLHSIEPNDGGFNELSEKEIQKGWINSKD